MKKGNKKTKILVTVIALGIVVSTVILGPKLFKQNSSSNKGKNYNASEAIDPTEWVAVDDLGRTVATNGDSSSNSTGNKNSKQVGIFAWNWHDGPTVHPGTSNISATLGEDYNVGDKSLSSGGSLYNAASTLSGYSWIDKPIYGYYSYNDRWVIRKELELLADAGVDFIMLDYSNYDARYLKSGNDNDRRTWDITPLLETAEAAKKDGIDVPKIGFLLWFPKTSHSGYDGKTTCTTASNTNTNIACDIENGKIETTKVLEWLYDNAYTKYDSSLFVKMDGKPFVMGDSSYLATSAVWKHDNTTENISLTSSSKASTLKNYFTFRPTGRGPADESNSWNWISLYPQNTYTKNGSVEQISVSPAQHGQVWDGKKYTIPFTGHCDGSTCHNARSRNYIANNNSTDLNYASYSYKYRNKTISVSNHKVENIQSGMSTKTYVYGENFNQQWEYAFSKNPQYIFVTAWNQGVVMRQKVGDQYLFVDEFNDNYSNDIEPKTGSILDNYYYQMTDNIRKFKGATAINQNMTSKTIDINGDASDWNDIKAYNHYSNEQTYSGGKYNTSTQTNTANNTFRNDFITAKATFDSSYVYFYIKTVNNITSYTNSNWMRLLLDTKNSETSDSTDNWEEYEYIVNRDGATANTLKLEKSSGGWNWTKVDDIPYKISGNVMQLKIPRSDLGLTSNSVKLNYKWADNNLSGGDIMSIYTDGDAAPGGRFAFPLRGSKEYKDPTKTDNKIAIPGCKSVTYNGKYQNLVAKNDGYSITNDSGREVGSYNITLTANDGYIFNDGSKSASLTCSISPKSVSVNWSNTTFTYDGKEHVPSASANSGINGVALTLSVSGGSKEVGSHTATATIQSASNSESSNFILTNNTVTYIINPSSQDESKENPVDPGKSQIAVPTCNSLSYNGKNQELVNSGTGYTLANNSKIDAGSYDVTVKTNDNYTFNDGKTNKTLTCKISPKNVSVSWSNLEFTYDGKNHIPSAFADSGIEGETISLDVTGEAKSAGTHKATASIKSITNSKSSNYNLVNSTTNFTIKDGDESKSNPDKPTDDKEIDAPVCNNLIYNGKSQDLVSSGTGYTLNNNKEIDAGSYIVSVKASVGYKFKDGSSSKDLSCRIKAKDVAVTWTNRSFEYDALEHSPSPKASSGIDNEVLNLKTSGSSKDLGTHTASVTLESVSGGRGKTTNYNLTNTTTTYDITKTDRNQSDNEISLPTCNKLVYNGKSQDFINTDSNYSVKNNSGIDAGSYDVIVSANGDLLFTGGTKTKTIKCNIDKKDVKVKWSNTSFTYDGLDHIPSAYVDNDIDEKINLTIEGNSKDKGLHKASAKITSVVGGQANINNYKLTNDETTFMIDDTPYEIISDVAKELTSKAKNISFKSKIAGVFTFKSKNSKFKLSKDKIEVKENENADLTIQGISDGDDTLEVTFTPSDNSYKAYTSEYPINVTLSSDEPTNVDPKSNEPDVKPFTIRYDYKNGTATISKTFNGCTKIEETNPRLEGNRFLGFTTDANAVEALSRYNPGSTYCGEDGDIDLYGVWSVETGISRYGLFIVIAIGSGALLFVLKKKGLYFKRFN